MVAHFESLLPDAQIKIIDKINFPFGKQLEIVWKSDILVGMHGAGLAHAIFMRPGSVLVELKPRKLKSFVSYNIIIVP